MILKMTLKTNNKGFTLIEAVIYIALLGLIMTGAVATAYQLLSGAGSLATKNTAQEEGNFVQRKLQWALSDMSNMPVVSGSGCSWNVSITKSGFASNPVELQRNTSVTPNIIEMREGGTGSYTAITTGNVSASCLKFASILPTGTGPAGITATTTINGLDFVVTKYIRK